MLRSPLPQTISHRIEDDAKIAKGNFIEFIHLLSRLVLKELLDRPKYANSERRIIDSGK